MHRFATGMVELKVLALYNPCRGRRLTRKAARLTSTTWSAYPAGAHPTSPSLSSVHLHATGSDAFSMVRRRSGDERWTTVHPRRSSGCCAATVTPVGRFVSLSRRSQLRASVPISFVCGHSSTGFVGRQWFTIKTLIRGSYFVRTSSRSSSVTIAPTSK